MRDQRQFPRLDVQCRARIRIGRRHYFGYVENLSRGGAKLTTVTPIRDAGNVLLRLPDLPPLHGHLRWADGTAGGVAFCRTLQPEELTEWTGSRAGEPASANRSDNYL